MVIQLNGHITEEGELKLDLPSGLPAGEARITIEIPVEMAKPSEALTRSLQIEPLTGAEIVAAGLTGGWAEEGITDGAAWVEEQRRKRRERRLARLG
jgi:hypothetical protein